MLGGITGQAGISSNASAASPIEESYAYTEINAESVKGNYTGGIAGYTYFSPVTKSYADADVSIEISREGSGNAGGILGNAATASAYSGAVSECYAKFKLRGNSGGYIKAGGIAGVLGQIYDAIADCYADVDITAYARYQTHLAGITGTNMGPVSRCYATGSLSGECGNVYISGNTGGTNSKSEISGISGEMGFVVEAEISYCAMYLSSMSATRQGTHNRTYIAKITQYSTLTASTSPCSFPGNIAYEAVVVNTTYKDNKYNDGTEVAATTLETETTYSNAIGSSGLGWDFTDIWKWDSANRRPRLQWQDEE
jgi:hypothetical protein